MTKILGLTGIIAVAFAAALAFGSTGGAASLTCKPGTTTFGGAPARVFCGPATATVHRGATTFVIRNGRCDRFGSTFTVNIGTVVLGKPSKPKPEYFGITVFGAAKDGVHHDAAISVVHHGRFSGSARGTVTLKGGRSRGTFSGGTVSGTFHC